MSAPTPTPAMATTYLPRTPLGAVRAARGRLGHWLAVVLGFPLAAGLVGAGVALYLRAPSTMGKLDVVTTPPGAEVWLDGRRIGTAPCTIERVGTGLHTLRAVHDGFLLAECEVLVEPNDAPEAVSFLLQPIQPEPPPAAGDGAPTERIAEFLQHAVEAFQRGDLATPANDNALYYADAVLLIQPDNGPARALRAQVRHALIRQAQLAAGRGDLATAQATYTLLLTRFPSDEQTTAGVARIADLIEANRGRATRFLALAEAALAEGRLLDPPQASAYFYLSQVLAYDRSQPQAQALRAEVRRRAQTKAETYVAAGDLSHAVAEYRRLVRLFPEDRTMYNRLRRLERQPAAGRPTTVAVVSLPAVRRTKGRTEGQTGTLRFSAAGLVFAAPNGAESLSLTTETIADLRASGGRLTVTTTDGETYHFVGSDLERGAAVWRAARKAPPDAPRPTENELPDAPPSNPHDRRRHPTTTPDG